MPRQTAHLHTNFSFPVYHVFYRKKQWGSPLKSFLIATPFCVISKMLYKGAELIPTYKDIRLPFL